MATLKRITPEILTKVRKSPFYPEGSSVELRFWERVTVGRHGECWQWHGLVVNEYGLLAANIDGKEVNLIASRVSWVLANGEIPDGHFVLHTCDNRQCCNPEHLYLGSTLDNANDRESRGRGKAFPGSSHASAKFTDEQIRLIRSSDSSSRSLAKSLGVSQSTIWKIQSGKSYRDSEVQNGN